MVFRQGSITPTPIPATDIMAMFAQGFSNSGNIPIVKVIIPIPVIISFFIRGTFFLIILPVAREVVLIANTGTARAKPFLTPKSFNDDSR